MNLGNKIISKFHWLTVQLFVSVIWQFTKVTIIQDNNQSILFITNTNLTYWLIKLLNAALSIYNKCGSKKKILLWMKLCVPLSLYRVSQTFIFYIFSKSCISFIYSYFCSVCCCRDAVISPSRDNKHSFIHSFIHIRTCSKCSKNDIFHGEIGKNITQIHSR